ncbi:MAG: hypothetical protein ACI90G_002445 [Urechidicola sp.]|jgi:hypothetical protein
MAVKFRYSVIWLISAVVGYGFALTSLTTDGAYHSYLFAGIDSYYHAARVLSTIATGQFNEWEAQSYYPTGAWITWPWAFDYGISRLASLFTRLTGNDPVTLLVNLPPLWIAVNLGLLLGICRALKLTHAMTAFICLGFSMLPLTQQVHMAGRLDHHFAELTFVLATTWFVTLLGRAPNERGYAIGLGISLGLAHGVNNGMFILQIPSLIFIGILWLQGRPLSLRIASYLCASFLVSLTLLLIFSEPFLQQEFHYYLLSWFQLYIAFCTAMIIIYTTVVHARTWTVTVLLLTGLTASIPLINDLLQGWSFIAAQAFSPMETDSLFALSFEELMLLYSPLVIAIPVSMAWLCVAATRDSRRYLAFSISATLGGLLLLAQVRFSYYGTFVLFIPTALMLQNTLQRFHQERFLWIASFMLITGLAVQGQTARSMNNLKDWTPEYLENRAVFTMLHDLCMTAPGLVLAHPNQGLYLQYHTDCSIVASNHNISPRHLAAYSLNMDYLALGAEKLPEALHDVRYVVIQRYDGLRFNERDEAKRLNSKGLHRDLLGDVEQLPESFDLLLEIRAERRGEIYPLTRLFRVNTVKSNLAP